MTLKLVTDNAEPRPNIAIADAIRNFADNISDYGRAHRAVMVLDYDGGLAVVGFGDNIGTIEQTGLLDMAKMYVFANEFVDGD